jgi:DNA polymerase
MICGEAPGLEENINGRPFTGPAGQLLDKIFKAVGWDTDTDWSLHNVMKCRPVAPESIQKQNLTPTAKQRTICLPYLEHEIDSINPKIIVLVGKTAANTLLGQTKNLSMKEIVGQTFSRKRWPNTVFFVMYHPAAILHAQNQPNRYRQLKIETWQHIQLLKQIEKE